MTVENCEVVDLVSVDPLSGIIFLSMVEERDWGSEGKLLPNLEAKLNTYLEYIEGGQLGKDYPDLVGKPVMFRLHYMHEPSVREREFIRIVVNQHLRPRGIAWDQSLISAEPEKPNQRA